MRAVRSLTDKRKTFGLVRAGDGADLAARVSHPALCSYWREGEWILTNRVSSNCRSVCHMPVLMEKPVWAVNCLSERGWICPSVETENTPWLLLIAGRPLWGWQLASAVSEGRAVTGPGGVWKEPAPRRTLRRSISPFYIPGSKNPPTAPWMSFSQSVGHFPEVPTPSLPERGSVGFKFAECHWQIFLVNLSKSKFQRNNTQFCVFWRGPHCSGSYPAVERGCPDSCSLF